MEALGGSSSQGKNTILYLLLTYLRWVFILRFRPIIYTRSMRKTSRSSLDECVYYYFLLGFFFYYI